MTMTTELFETIAAIDPDQWDQLVAGRPFANWRWLRATETLLGDSKSRYVILSQDGVYQAGAVCLIQNRFHSRLLQSAMGWLPRFFPYVRCDMSLAIRSGLFFADATQFDRVIPALLTAVKTLAQSENALFYSFDHLLATDAAWPYLQALNLHRIAHFSEASLDVHWATLETYLESLAEPECQELKRVQAVLRQQNIVLETAVPLNEDLATLQNLVSDLASSQKKPYRLPQDLFSTTHRLLGDDFQLIVARQDGRTIGCVILLRDDQEWLVRWPGVSVTHPLQAEIYTALLVACVQQVILAGGQRLYLGVTAPQMQKQLGATLEKRFGATAVRNRFLHWLGGRLLKVTANPDADQSTTT
ncbi:MAG: GNAT family N-acetyltransferase [Anaerolineales bacterium]|nr:GNAT family N-acetyltransferase [Anaerolineales bacterium]